MQVAFYWLLSVEPQSQEDESSSTESHSDSDVSTDEWTAPALPLPQAPLNKLTVKVRLSI